MTPTLLVSPTGLLPIKAQNGDDVPYEVVDDRLVELPPMSTYSIILASRLHGRLDVWAESKKTGQAASEPIFGLSTKPRLWRRPDVAFVSFQRWAKGRPFPFTDPWPVVPELAVEVVSPNDLAEDLRVKVADYFRHGVQLVWVVWPRVQLIDVYDSLTQNRILTRADTLDGGSVLPGFTLPLTELFRETIEPSAETEPPATHA